MNPDGGQILEIRSVHKRFGEVEAVAGVTAAFERGEYVCIIGPSGCGKTTLLRMIAGFEEPDAGDLLLDGRSVAGVPPERRDVNVVFQSYALFPHMTVRENVAFGPRMKRLTEGEIRSRVDEALALARLDDLAARLPTQLSGGQQQRVALARALANRPRLLLLDEPLSALDRSLRLQMQEELRRLQRETGLTFLHVTHDQGEGLSLSDRLVVMRGGRFEQVGSPRELYARPGSRFVAEFLGSSNLLEGIVESSGARDLRVETAIGLVVASTEPSLGTTRHARGSRILVSIRPEALVVLNGAQARSSGEVASLTNRFTGLVQSASFGGAHVELKVAVAGGMLRVLTTPTVAAGLAEGALVTLQVRPEEVVPIPAEERA
jgi:spermidine/putrescine transport system ATP-binding protein